MPEFNDELICIVDDDEPVRDSLKLLLEAYRLRVREYSSCQAFIEDLGHGEAQCLLLDLHLPMMGGLDFLERHGRTLGGLPVIMITGRGDPASLARAHGLGVATVLDKPFAEGKLLETLRGLLPAPVTREDDPQLRQ